MRGGRGNSLKPDGCGGRLPGAGQSARRGAPERSAPRSWWLLAGLQGDLAEAGRDVEASHAFDADRLQRDLIAVAADQHVGAEADPSGDVSGNAGVLPGERALRDLAGR